MRLPRNQGQIAAGELRDIDPRRLFWARLVAVMTAEGAESTAEDVDWDALKADLEGWRQTLPPSSTDQHQYLVTDWLCLVFAARPRNDALRGVRRSPSSTLSDPAPPPPLQLADGETADFSELTLAHVQDFRVGPRAASDRAGFPPDRVECFCR